MPQQDEIKTTEPANQPPVLQRLGFDQITWIILGFFVVLSTGLFLSGFSAYWRMTHKNAARKALTARNYEEAVPYLVALSKSKSKEGQTDRFWAHEQLALCYLVLEKPDEALENAKKMTELYPEANIAEYIGAAYAQKGDLQRANEAFSRLLNADPNNPAANFHFGVQKLKAGNLLEAGQCFARASTNPVYDKKAETYRAEIKRRLEAGDTPAAATPAAKGK